MAGIFKAYDIRGLYGKTLTDDIARRIGQAFVRFLDCRRVVVGRDMRTHSKALFDALAEGINEQGANVIDLGLCSTPMCYHANGLLEADGGIMITASHNPGPWNGFKLCREQAIPISGATGIADIEKLAGETPPPPAGQRGNITSFDVREAYAGHVRALADLPRRPRVVADYANAMGVLEGRVLEGLMHIEPMFDELDGTFPNHEANPLKQETLEALCQKVRAGGYDFGIAFDGDADRVGFVDEKGAMVPMDLVTALMAQSILDREKGPVLYDLRSSWAVKEVIAEAGGTPVMSRVGHAFIKQQMRDMQALFAGELSGHYYFRENYYTESAAMAVLLVANRVSASGQSLSELVRPLRRYTASGEINSRVMDTEAVFERLRKAYGHGRVITLDGLSVSFDNWWFNVRASNTEPLIRLNVEAEDRESMQHRRDELLALIRAGEPDRQDGKHHD